MGSQSLPFTIIHIGLLMNVALCSVIPHVVLYKGIPTDIRPAETALTKSVKETALSIHQNLFTNYIQNTDYSKIDMAILMDSSTSLGAANFFNGKSFLSLLISLMPRDDFSDKRIRTAMYSFSVSSRLTEEFGFDSMTYRELIRRNIYNATYHNGGYTHMTTALIWIDSIFKTAARSDAKKILIIATDGKSNDDSVDNRGLYGPVETLRSNGVEVFIVALGDRLDFTKLAVLSSGKSSNLYHIKNNSSMVSTVEELLNSLRS